MTKLTIVEAALEALNVIDAPATVKQTNAKIMERSLYKFGAKDPLAVLRIQMERHSELSTWSSEAKNKLFSKTENGEFYPINSRKVVTEGKWDKVDTLQLVNKLANKLKSDTISSIVSHLYSLEPEEFEHFCRKFLERYGFEDMTVTKRGRDGGIDVFGTLEVGISNLHVAAQCKRYKKSNKISRPDIDKFRGAIQGEYQQGIFITTSSFTKEAQEYAFR